MGCTSGSGTGSAAPTGGSGISPWTIVARRAGRISAGAGLVAALTGAMPVGTVAVGIDSVRSTKGLIRVCLTADPANFPACVDDADAVTRSIPAAQRALRFDGLPLGTYAIAVIHDENSNARLDTLAGIPREGYGFSRNAAVRFGPPKFAAARFTLAGDAESQQIRMRYIF